MEGLTFQGELFYGQNLADFRGGVGHSLVIDSAGRLWRARSYEDFDTTYRFVGASCEIDTLTPLYGQMVEYRLR